MIDQAGQALGAFYACVSIVCFTAYALDKRAARTGRRRTPERTLLLLGLMGGWPGAFLAQRTLRHKSSKRAFQMKFWLTVVLNIAVAVAVVAGLRM
jgi:uncharacterized membrane protein YsdA (DUF1294 family)